MSEKEKQKAWQALAPSDLWEIFLIEGNEGVDGRAPWWFRILHSFGIAVLRRIPSDPRCVSCEAPFMGIGAPLMRAIGRDRSRYNPSLCAACENLARKFGARAEVPLTMLFADIRGSTSLAEKISAEEFSQLVSRFYSTATDVLVRANGCIDKLIGDEASAFFVPGMAGHDHAKKAVAAGREILRQTGHDSVEGPWVPVGIGIHRGPAMVGAVGQAGGLTDITVLGDTANTAARLASQAGTGEIILSVQSAKEAGIESSQLEERKLRLKGKSKAFDAWSLKVSD